MNFRMVGVWGATTGAEIAVLRGHEDGVTSAAFSPVLDPPGSDARTELYGLGIAPRFDARPPGRF